MPLVSSSTVQPAYSSIRLMSVAAAEIMGTAIACATAELISSEFSTLIDFESDSFHWKSSIVHGRTPVS